MITRRTLGRALPLAHARQPELSAPRSPAMADVVNMVETVFEHHNPVQASGDAGKAAGAGGAAALGTVALSASEAARLAEDSNAIVVPDWFVRSRGLVCHPKTGEPTRLVRALPWMGVLRMFMMSVRASEGIDSLTSPSATDVFYMVTIGTFWLLTAAFTMTAFELSAVLRKGGELEMLGLGETKISASAFASLNRQYMFLRFVQLVTVGNGFGWMGGGLGSIGKSLFIRHPHDPWEAVTAWGVSIFPMGHFFLFEASLFVELVLTLQVAAALSADGVLEVVHGVRKTDPKETEAWEKDVVRPALALVNGHVGLLSNGWSRALALSFFGLWSMAIGVFSLMLYLLHKHGDAFGIVVLSPALLGCLIMPLVMSSAVAAVSTSCDDLASMINERRIEDLDVGPRLFQLEIALKNLNNGQGLGFVVGENNVLDKRKLRTLYLSIAGVWTTLIPILLALGTSDTAPRYAKYADSPTIYLYSPENSEYESAITFCESRWMQLAVFHSDAEAHGLLHPDFWTGKRSFVGIRTNPATAKFEHFLDGTPWWKPDADCPACYTDDADIYMAVDKDGDWIEWDPTSGDKAVLCTASSIDDIIGDLPHVLNLGSHPDGPGGGPARATTTTTETNANEPSCTVATDQAGARIELHTLPFNDTCSLICNGG